MVVATKILAAVISCASWHTLSQETTPYSRISSTSVPSRNILVGICNIHTNMGSYFGKRK